MTEVQEDVCSMDTEVQGAPAPAEMLDDPAATSALTGPPADFGVAHHIIGQPARKAPVQPRGPRTATVAEPVDGHADANASVPQQQPQRRRVRLDPVVKEAMPEAAAAAQKPGCMTRAQRAIAEHQSRIQTRAARAKLAAASGASTRAAAPATAGAAGKGCAPGIGRGVQKSAGGCLGAIGSSIRKGESLRP